MLSPQRIKEIVNLAEEAASLVDVGAPLVSQRDAVDRSGLHSVDERALFCHVYAGALAQRGQPITDNTGLVIRWRERENPF